MARGNGIFLKTKKESSISRSATARADGIWFCGTVPLCALAQLDHLAESYKLDAAIHLDRESLVEGTTAKVILRPLLRLNGNPVSTDLLEETKLIIHSSDHDGTPGMMEIDLPKFEQGKDLVHEFKVPKKPSTLRFELRTKVQNLSKATKQSHPARPDLYGQPDGSHPQARGSLSVPKRRRIFVRSFGRNGEIVSDRALVLKSSTPISRIPEPQPEDRTGRTD